MRDALVLETKAIIGKNSVDTLVPRKMNSNKVKPVQFAAQTMRARNLFKSGYPVVAQNSLKFLGTKCIAFHFKMAYHMLRRSGVRSFAQLLLRKQNLRLLSSSARIFFASNECPQYLTLVSRHLVAQPPFFSVRSFADVGAALGKEEIQTRVLDVLKLFDKVDAEKVRVWPKQDL